MTTRSSSAASLVLEAGLGDVCSVVIYIEVPDPPSSTPDRELDFAPLRPTPPQGTSNLWKPVSSRPVPGVYRLNTVLSLLALLATLQRRQSSAN
ncbi:hypothetical protein CIHG_02186 [Coccidioides immitis H538.4]|uniref:Uncharacterized protein n=1 Tax=Coccidioides immitis H538.4 TaxID=396776 RepID=A0A0J8RIC5_COCIT|nr:hypothetical protein CIHG_02186 [Coccidioides immitis H538.4]